MMMAALIVPFGISSLGFISWRRIAAKQIESQDPPLIGQPAKYDFSGQAFSISASRAENVVTATITWGKLDCPS